MTLFDPYPGGFVLFRDDCIPFDVLDKNTWYRVDANHPVHEQYEKVPDDIQHRVDVAIRKALGTGGTLIGYKVDPAPYYEAAPREKFDDVSFVGSGFVPGVVC